MPPIGFAGETIVAAGLRISASSSAVVARHVDEVVLFMLSPIFRAFDHDACLMPAVRGAFAMQRGRLRSLNVAPLDPLPFREVGSVATRSTRPAPTCQGARHSRAATGFSARSAHQRRSLPPRFGAAMRGVFGTPASSRYWRRD